MSGIMSMLLGAVSSAITDVYFNLVTLLLPGNGTNGAQNNTFLDSSTNNFTITRNGNTTQGTFSPFSQTGWSNYFGGDGNYLSTAYSADFSFSTGEFSIECWAYVQDAGRTADANKYGALISQAVAASTTNQWQFLIRIVSGVITEVVLEVNGASALSVTGQSISINAWHHFVLCRSGTTLSIFVDGTRIGTITYSTAINSNTSGTLQIARNAYANTYQNWLSGYISNVRILNGTSAYSASVSTFTVPASPITDVTNTKLLTCQSNRFIDANTQVTAKTITITGTPSVQAFSPFLPTVAYTPQTIGGSGYFDGSGDYLSFASNAAFTVGTGNLTIEAWIYVTSLSQTYQGIASGRAETPSNFPGLGLTIDNSQLFFTILNSGSGLRDSANVPLNQWVHVVGVRSGTNAALFVNGARKASSTNSENGTSSDMVIGRYYVGTNNYYFSGYIAGARLLKGTAAYDPTQTSITVPTAPFTDITNTSFLLNYTNAGIIDATAKNDLETVGNAQISTTQSKFGNSSMYFDGTGDYLTLPNLGGQFDFRTGDFTIELWVFASSGFSSLATVISKGPVGTVDNTSWTLQHNTAGSLSFYGPSSTLYFTTTSTPWTTGFAHIAICRSGSNTRLFVNGTQQGSTYTTLQDFLAGNPLIVGSGYYDPANRTMTGYIDDLRISKYARYTANFTAPTSAFALQ
jgi:hypothetical protein